MNVFSVLHTIPLVSGDIKHNFQKKNKCKRTTTTTKCWAAHSLIENAVNDQELLFQ